MKIKDIEKDRTLSIQVKCLHAWGISAKHCGTGRVSKIKALSVINAMHLKAIMLKMYMYI